VPDRSRKIVPAPPQLPSGMTVNRRLSVMFPASLSPGGAERQMLLLAEHLPRARFEVSFVLLGGMTGLALEAQRLGATVHVLGAPHRAGSPMPIFAVKVARRVASYVALCRRERFDIVDAWLYLGYGLAAATRPVSRIPVLIAGRRSLSEFKARFGVVERTVDQIARRSADVIVANSWAVADDVVRREGVNRSRIRVIRNGVVLPQPRDEARRRAARAALDITDDEPVVGCVGTFKRGKGQARVVEAMSAARQQVPGAWLVFVGDGPERSTVEQCAQAAGLERARFIGTVPDARVLYDGFDAVVSASDAEGLPNVVLEAAAAGRPIVATAAGGTPEIVIDGETGLLVPVGDTEGLGRALTRVLNDEDLARRLGSAAREHAATTFGLERFVTETAALYEEMDRRHVG
jgi:glycosyltransferase involved in cell wall biosynthesis